ncbi:histidinol-phosphate transaminase [Phaeovibrio sulfidiphilus]|uniref:Histidinol-phosphate aminotransferase n=1 Tax=Phaeovibrio sulfidiphilus TaxID=1220600 RepID=A0A8J7CD84_9PROT|nr:histidinol-phosphate transaminase [Phaeovibrio sulfidiphilus]MBE1237563.1 histidinol-phosphate transaminase [Phaeovibrio sulfidiphilus]
MNLSNTPLPRPGIMDIVPYAGGESKIPGVSRIIKLASNEGALGCSPRARDAMIHAAGDVYRYPDGACVELREAIGQQYGIDPARIVCGAGSDELIGMLIHSYAGPGDTLVQSRYGFLMYSIYGKSAGVETLFAPETNLTADVDALLATVKDTTRLVFLANPNNPTGTILPPSEVQRLREGLRDDIILALDSAYCEFVQSNSFDGGIGLVNSHPNTVMLRTFSKIHGMGGIRLGWAYGPAHIVDVLNRVRGPFNVSALAQVAGVAAIKDTEFQDSVRAHNRLWREWTREKMEALGLVVTPSEGNFLLATFPSEGPRTAERADAFLRSRGLICRRVAGYGLPDSLRVSIGTGEEMELFVQTLTEFMEEGGGS